MSSENSANNRKRRSYEGKNVYVTAEFKSGDLPQLVVVGNGSKIGGYENKKLVGGHSYSLFIRTFVRQGSKYVNITSSLTKKLSLPLLTTPPPSQEKSKQQSSFKSKPNDSGNSGIIIAAGVIGTLFLLLISAVIIFVVR